MTLIIGGAYQGKLSYALKRFSPSPEEVYRCGESAVPPPADAKIICGLEQWILALVRAGENVKNAVETLLTDAPEDLVIICTDISCGVVPEDPVLRIWREETGRALAVISQNSGEVIRLFCGIAAKIK